MTGKTIWGVAHLGNEVIVSEGRDEGTWIFSGQWWGRGRPSESDEAGGGPLRVMRRGRPEGLCPGEVRMEQNRKKWKKESDHLMAQSSLETS